MSNITRAARLARTVERHNSGVHSGAIYADYTAAAAELRRLAESEAKLLDALERLEKEFRRVFPIYYYAEPWAHNENLELRVAQQLIAATKEARNG